MLTSITESIVAFVKANKVFIGIVTVLLALSAVQGACSQEVVAEEVETSTETTLS